MILKQIEEKLQEIDPNVYYGAAWKHDNETLWNYIVFNRRTVKHSTNKTADTDYYDVHIVRENYIPEGLDAEVIAKVTELAGFRLAGNDDTFQYERKPNSDVVLEIQTITFIRARKNV